MKPNILLLMTDQMRGDCLGAAGHPDVQTPYLDSLIGEGDYFPNAYTACPSCIAARASLMTGLSPRHTCRVGYQDGVVWDYPRTLAGELGKAGYQTQCVGKLHAHPLRNRLGFDSVTLHDGYLGYYRRPETSFCEHQTIADDYFHWLKCELGADVDVTDTGLECNSWLTRPWPYPEQYHPTNWVAQNSIDFLRRRDRSSPFFLYASFVRPHPPFDAPTSYFERYLERDLAPPPVGDWAAPLAGPARYDSWEGPSSPKQIQQMRAGYYACITHLDHQIGRILQALFEDGSLNNTVILFCSDHGEQLGDHHTFRKSRPYQGSIRIPFFIHLPGQQAGRIHSELAGLQDVLPTLLELAGETPPDGLDGLSLVPLLNGEEPGSRAWMHGEHSGGAMGNQFIVTPTDKYIWFMESGREQYFDLAADPNELHDLIRQPSRQKRIAELRACLIQELAGREEGYTDGARLIPGQEQRNLLSSPE